MESWNLLELNINGTLIEDNFIYHLSHSFWRIFWSRVEAKGNYASKPRKLKKRLKNSSGPAKNTNHFWNLKDYRSTSH